MIKSTACVVCCCIEFFFNCDIAWEACLKNLRECFSLANRIPIIKLSVWKEWKNGVSNW